MEWRVYEHRVHDVIVKKKKKEKSQFCFKKWADPMEKNSQRESAHTPATILKCLLF